MQLDQKFSFISKLTKWLVTTLLGCKVCHTIKTFSVSLNDDQVSFSNYRLQEDPPAGVSGAPTENNIMLWNAIIFG